MPDFEPSVNPDIQSISEQIIGYSVAIDTKNGVNMLVNKIEREDEIQLAGMLERNSIQPDDLANYTHLIVEGATTVGAIGIYKDSSNDAHIHLFIDGRYAQSNSPSVVRELIRRLAPSYKKIYAHPSTVEATSALFSSDFVYQHPNSSKPLDEPLIYLPDNLLGPLPQ